MQKAKSPRTWRRMAWWQPPSNTAARSWICRIDSVVMNRRPKILFVCGRNKWRSPTAENVYENDSRVNVRSAGMSDKSSHQISSSDIEWADLVLVMERKYKTRILSEFRDYKLPPIESLEIPDEY